MERSRSAPPRRPVLQAGGGSGGDKKKNRWGFGWSGALKKIRGKVSKKKIRYRRGSFDLDLTLITPRIIAMGFPSTGHEGLYRNPMTEVSRFLQTYYSFRYRVYNLCSERSYDGSAFCDRVVRFGFQDHNPAPLRLIGEFCRDVEAWLGRHPENVVAIHCKAGKGRTGLMIAAYLLYCGMFNDPDEALAYFGHMRTSNGKGVTIPSQVRYVHYFYHTLKYGPSPVFTYRIMLIRLVTVPNMDGSGGCIPNVEVSVENEPVFQYREAGGTITRVRRPAPYVDLDLSAWNVRVRENVKLQFLHEQRRNMCHLWFHTSYIEDDFLVFPRHLVDKANKDKTGQFLPEFQVEVFLHRVDGPPSPPIPVRHKKNDQPTAFGAGEEDDAVPSAYDDYGLADDFAADEKEKAEAARRSRDGPSEG